MSIYTPQNTISNVESRVGEMDRWRGWWQKDPFALALLSKLEILVGFLVFSLSTPFRKLELAREMFIGDWGQAIGGFVCAVCACGKTLVWTACKYQWQQLVMHNQQEKNSVEMRVDEMAENAFETSTFKIFSPQFLVESIQNSRIQQNVV